jgi:O-antigen/teichoic acid export membrane protein
VADFGAEVASRAVSPIALVVLARLLSPKQFGVVAVATIVVSFESAW